MVFADGADRKIARLAVSEVEAAYRRCRIHRETFRERDAGRFFRIEQLKQYRFFGVVRLRRIARRGPNAAILFRDQIFLA